VIGRPFWDKTAPITLAEASVVKSKGSLKSGYLNMTSSDDKMFRRCSKALRWLSSNSIATLFDVCLLTDPFSTFSMDVSGLAIEAFL